MDCIIIFKLYQRCESSPTARVNSNTIYLRIKDFIAGRGKNNPRCLWWIFIIWIKIIVDILEMMTCKSCHVHWHPVLYWFPDLFWVALAYHQLDRMCENTTDSKLKELQVRFPLFIYPLVVQADLLNNDYLLGFFDCLTVLYFLKSCILMQF